MGGDAEVGRRKSEDNNTSGVILWRSRVRFWASLTPTPDLSTSQILLIPPGNCHNNAQKCATITFFRGVQVRTFTSALIPTQHI